MSEKDKNTVAYREDVRKRLIEVAKEGSKIHYGELKSEFHIARGRHIAKVLGEISNFESKNKRPLLSSIVIHVSNEYPNGAFFGCDGIPEQLKRQESSKKALSLSEKEFVDEEQKRVWDYWKKHGN